MRLVPPATYVIIWFPRCQCCYVSGFFLLAGANRGVGLEYVQQLLSRPNYRVAAAAREPHGHPVLQNLKTAKADRLMLLNVDITDKASVKAGPSPCPLLTWRLQSPFLSAYETQIHQDLQQ